MLAVELVLELVFELVFELLSSELVFEELPFVEVTVSSFSSSSLPEVLPEEPPVEVSDGPVAELLEEPLEELEVGFRELDEFLLELPEGLPEASPLEEEPDSSSLDSPEPEREESPRESVIPSTLERGAPSSLESIAV